MTVLRLPEPARNQPEISADYNGFGAVPVPPAAARRPRRNTAFNESVAGIFGEVLREVTAADRHPLSSYTHKTLSDSPISWNRRNLGPIHTSRLSRRAKSR